jgi:hypothetical protein
VRVGHAALGGRPLGRFRVDGDAAQFDTRRVSFDLDERVLGEVWRRRKRVFDKWKATLPGLR